MIPLYLFLVLVTAATGEDQTQVENYSKELWMVKRIYQDCSKSDWGSCLKMKLASALDRISKNYKVIHLLDGVSFVNEKTSSGDSGPEEDHFQGSRGNGENSSPDVMLLDRFIRFLSTYTLHVKFSNLSGIKNSIEEARGKYGGGGKKYGYFLLVPLMMAGTVLPLAFGALALLAGKALIISKLALLLAGIIALKKLFTISHHDHHHGGYHERQFRSMNDISGSLDAQNLAYRGQK